MRHYKFQVPKNSKELRGQLFAYLYTFCDVKTISGPQEIEAILNYLNIELRRLRSSFFKKYLENYQRALSSRDVEKYVDGEADVVDYEKIINEFALLRNKWLGLLKGLDQKQWQITNVVKLRVAGMEDASL